MLALALFCWLPGLRAQDVDEEVQGLLGLIRRETNVAGALETFCPHLHEVPAIFTTFWEKLHRTAVQLERDLAAHADASDPQHEIRALCVQLALLRTVVHGDAGLAFPQAANSCPTLLGIYFEWASGLALRVEQPRRARALLQLGAPLQLMALSRAMMRWA